MIRRLMRAALVTPEFSSWMLEQLAHSVSTLPVRMRQTERFRLAPVILNAAAREARSSNDPVLATILLFCAPFFTRELLALLAIGYIADDVHAALDADDRAADAARKANPN